MEKARILVVEDERIVAADLEACLLDGGYEVTSVVSSGEDAIKAAETDSPDLVLMDIILEGDLDGIEAASAISSGLNIPVVYLTAYSEESVLERAKGTGPSGYLIKPFRDRELYSTIDTAIYKHRLETKVRERKEWLTVTLRSIADGVIATDGDGRVTLMNSAAQSITGWTEEEAAGQSLAEVLNLVDAKTRDRIEVSADRLVGGTGAAALSTQNIVLIGKNGAEASVQASAAPIEDTEQGQIGTVVVFQDVTERRRAEEKLSLVSQAVEQSSEGIAVTDVEGNLLFLNPAFVEMHGYSGAELLGKNLSVFHTDDQMPSVLEANRQLKQEGHFSGEIWHARSDASVFPGLMHNSVLCDTDGGQIGMIKTLRDITEIKEAEEQLRKSHEELEAYSTMLEEMVRERTKDLEESRSELRRYSVSLEQANEALRIVIEGIEQQKREVENKVKHNLNLTVNPVLEHLKAQEASAVVGFLLKSLDFNLANMFSTFGTNLVEAGQTMTPSEIRICEMIRSGLTSKQIARVVGISSQTVLVHRKNIRKKLGLSNSKMNLVSYLRDSL